MTKSIPARKRIGEMDETKTFIAQNKSDVGWRSLIIANLTNSRLTDARKMIRIRMINFIVSMRFLFV